MFENDTNADETVSRRSVLETAGGLLAGSTVLAGLGSERGAATPEGHGPLRAELRERNEEYIAVEVWFPDDIFDGIKPLNDVYPGDSDQFVVHEDEGAVSLPEDTDGLANPVHFERINERGERPKRYLMYFRTDDGNGWPFDEEVTLGLGLFTERTIPGTKWDTCPGHRDY